MTHTTNTQSAVRQPIKCHKAEPITDLPYDRLNSIPITYLNGEPRIDSRCISELLGKKHKNTIELIDRYATEISLFGLLPFQTEASPIGPHSGGEIRYAALNEDQAFFLLALSRNTKRVVALKSSLIMAFRKARLERAYLTLEAGKREASASGRRLAQWRYDKPGIYQYVENLKEQLKLPFEQESIRS